MNRREYLGLCEARDRMHRLGRRIFWAVMLVVLFALLMAKYGPAQQIAGTGKTGPNGSVIGYNPTVPNWLYVNTDAQGNLMVDCAVGCPAGAPGAMVLIQTQTLGSTQTSVTFSAIPQTSTHLMLVGSFNASGGANLAVTFNGDTTAGHYSWGLNFQNNGAASGNFNSTSQASMLLGGSTGSVQLTIPGYTATPSGISVMGDFAELTNKISGTSSGQWTGTDVTSITLTQSNSAAFAVGSVFSLYAIGAGGGGGGGGGSVNSGNAWQIGAFPAAGNTIGPAPNLYALTPSMTLSQINTLFASLTRGQDEVTIPPSVKQLGWTNALHITTRDARNGAALIQLGGEGVACDANHFNLTLTSGSNQVTVGGDFGTEAVGKVLTFATQTGYLYNSPQYTWVAGITAVAGGVATLSANAPFNFSGTAQYGTDNYTNAQAAIDNWGYAFPFLVPTGCNILTSKPLSWNEANSFIGMQMNGGGFVGGPISDILQHPDVSSSTDNSAGIRVENLTFDIDSGVDPTQVTGGPITSYSQNGTGTTIPAIYRPLHEYPSQDANYPCGPGWISGTCVNGVSTTAQNSAVICTPNALAPPVVGQAIMFPYFAPIFASTVSSTAGSCSAGFTARTMAAAFPNTSGYTATQQEWFTGTAFQSTTTTIPTTITYPLTLNLTLPIQPVPGGESNFATHGHIAVCGIEMDYMGVGGYGSNIAVARRGPTTSNGCTGTTVMAPLNPCPAKNLFGSNADQPWPVTPTINSGDSTPSGATVFPGRCGGAAGISFPQANGNTFAGGGLVGSFLEHLQFNVTTTQLANMTQEIYFAGNTAPYSSDVGWIYGNYTTFGVSQGPASAGQHGVTLVGPTGQGNTFHDFHIHAAFPLSLVDFQGGQVNEMDLYTTEVSPFDGSTIGKSACGVITPTMDEQTGGTSTTPNYNKFNVGNCEPETGNGIEEPGYWQADGTGNTYDTYNFEGPFTIFGGNNQKVINSAMSVPWINLGVNNDFEGLRGLTASYISNVWSSSTMNWGTLSSCSAYAGGNGPLRACGAGFLQPSSGSSIGGSFYGINVQNFEGGRITPGMWSDSTDAAPMSVDNQIDATEPVWGRYAGCNLNAGGAQCRAEQFNGFSGYEYIGPFNDIAPIPYRLQFDVKSASGAGQMQMSVSAFDDGTSTCLSPGIITQPTITTTTSWVPWNIPVDFTGKNHCVLAVQFYNATTTDQYRIGQYDFTPAPGSVPGPTSAPTEGGSCPMASSWLGAFSGFTYFCDGGVVKRVAIT